MQKLMSLLLVVIAPLGVHAQNDSFVLNGKVVPKLSATRAYEADDLQLQVNNGVTVEDLSLWARQGKSADLENLFSNYSVSMRCLPSGTSSGKAGQVLSNQVGKVPGNVLTILAEASWYGKQFLANAGDCTISRGVNRIYALRYVNFVTRIVERADLVSTRSNIVELNYSQPGFGIIPSTVKALGVYDLMVAIPGKYGPIYVGKTWFGDYQRGNSVDSFKATTAQTNWYFLDFNEAALQAEKK